jgi:hypothetical protein
MVDWSEMGEETKPEPCDVPENWKEPQFCPSCGMPVSIRCCQSYYEGEPDIGIPGRPLQKAWNDAHTFPVRRDNKIICTLEYAARRGWTWEFELELEPEDEADDRPKFVS